MTTLPIKMCRYKEQEEMLKSFMGKHIFAQSNTSSVLVYQTFSPEIAEYAVDHGFFGGPGFDFNRTTWFKPSFLWTMESSNWATLPGRERVLAITVDKEFFAKILQIAVDTGRVLNTKLGTIESETVTLDWDYDRGPSGKCLRRYTLLVGLRGHILQRLNNKYIDVISDITGFARDQHILAQAEYLDDLFVPTLEQFVISESVLRKLQQMNSLCDSTRKENLSSLGTFQPNTEIVLYYQGSFNPVHTKHVKAIRECKSWIEHITESKVVAGVMGVKSDEFVAGKIENNENFDGLVIKAEHRIEMCKIAVAPYEWIYVYDMDECEEKDEIVNAFISQNFGPKVKVYYIFGADRGIWACKKRLDKTIIIGREGWSKPLKNAHSKMLKDGAENNRDVVVVPVEIENVSSTAIRREIKTISGLESPADKRVVLNRMVEKGWLDVNVTEYLLNHEHNLYECAYNMTKKASYRTWDTHL